MKPKTKIQKKVVGLSAKLKPITEKQKQYAFEKCFEKFVVISRKTSYCLECGHSWHGDGSLVVRMTGCTCPNCGKILTYKIEYHRYNTQTAYFSIITVVDDMQVVRFFFVKKWFKKRTVPEYMIKEVMQHWIDEAGDVTTISRPCIGPSMYFDQWNWEHEMEVRPPSFQKGQKYFINPFLIHPNRKVLQIIKRNGFKGYYYDIAPHLLFSDILKNKTAETLLKANQIKLLKHFMRWNYESIEEFWPSIKICIRNGYRVNDSSNWIDMIRMLKRMGKDVRNPKFICPVDIEKEHDRLAEKIRKIDQKEQYEKLKQKLEEDQLEYEMRFRKFMDLFFSDGELYVKPIETVRELMKEGEELKHCVFASEYHKKPDSLLLSARIGDKSIETVEFSLTQMRVVQSRGFKNCATEHHDMIVKLIEENVFEIKKRIGSRKRKSA